MATTVVAQGDGAGLYRDGRMVASAAEVKRAGYDLDSLAKDAASLKGAEVAVSRMQAMPVTPKVNYEDDGDVFWA